MRVIKDHLINQTAIDQMWIYFRLNDHPQKPSKKLEKYLQERFLFPDKISIYLDMYNTFWKQIFLTFVQSNEMILACTIYQPGGDNVYIIEKVKQKYKCKWGSLKRNEIEEINDIFIQNQTFGKWCIVVQN